MEALNEATRMRKRFLELLNRQVILVLPGGFSPPLAKITQEAGF